jgi:hypothetical protein
MGGESACLRQIAEGDSLTHERRGAVVLTSTGQQQSLNEDRLRVGQACGDPRIDGRTSSDTSPSPNLATPAQTRAPHPAVGAHELIGLFA